MPPIYRKFIRETAGHPAAYVPSVYSRNLSDTILTPDALTAALQLYPRIKLKNFDETMRLLDSSSKAINPLKTLTFPILFPRMQGGTQLYTSAWAINNGIIHCDAVLLGGRFENVESSRPAAINTIQGGNGYGINCKAIQYIIGDYATTLNTYSMGSGNAPTWYNELIANNWLLYLVGTSGTTAKNFFNSSFTQTNMSDYASVPTNARGLKVADELARQALNNFVTGGLAGCAPNLAGFFLDNCGVYCGGGSNVPATADWDRDGTTDTTKSDAVALKWRTGLKRFFDYMRAVNPALKLCGNLDATAVLANGTNAYKQAPSTIDPWPSMFDGVMQEAVFGQSYSIERWGGYAEAMRSVQFAEDLVRDPSLCMFGNTGLASNGTDAYRTTPYQGFRFSSAACHVHTNMGLSWTKGSGVSADGIGYKNDWYDEFSAHPVTGVCASGWSSCGPNRKWMGTARDSRVAYNATAWQNGCHRRIFNGAAGKAVHVMVNPNTSPATLTSDTNLRRLTGTQAPSVNNGAAQNIGSTFTIPAQDGIYMLEQ